MGVISNVEIWDARRSVESGNRSEGTVSHFRAFLVETSLASDDGAVVLASTIVIGTRHPNDFNAWLEHREAINDPKHRLIWRANLEYTSIRTRAINPLAEPAQIAWSTAHFTKPAQKDRNGEGVVNSAGDPYDPASERDDSRDVATITKNVAVIPSWYGDYSDAVNSNAGSIDGRTVAVGTAKIFDKRISPKRIRNGIIYRTMEIEVHFNPDGWDISELDRGFRELDGTSGNRKAIVNDADSSDPSQPVLLNGSGGGLSNPSASNAVFIDHEVYNQRDFSVIPVT